MSLRFHEIAETSHRILNPLNREQLLLLGEICQLHEDMRVLDLACGKGEMLVQWACTHGIMGVGVDISTVFIAAAKERAFQMDVGNKLNFVLGDAADYPEAHHQFDVVNCIGATWIGKGLLGTLALMQSALKDDGGLLLVGEPFWNELPPDEVHRAMGTQPDTFATLGGTLERFDSVRLELLEMVNADLTGWDRYEAQQWMAVRQFLDENPGDQDAEALQAWITNNRHTYMNFGRKYMGWGVFVLRKAQSTTPKLRENHNPDRPVGVEVAENMVWVRLEDGRVIGNPLVWYPWLEQATAEHIDHVELTANGVNWPDLGHRLEVAALLRGKH